MKILFNIGHPAQVHFFENAIKELIAHGHKCLITVINKEVSIQLLRASGLEFEVVGNARSSISGKTLEMSFIEARLLKIAISFKPDLLIGGVGNVYVAHVGKLIHRPSIVFDDTEHSKYEHLLMDPFVSSIVTPSCYRNSINHKQIRYYGFHQLAYLHPNRFTPDPSVLDELGLDSNDNIFLVRFAAFNASHDVNTENFNKNYIMDLIAKLDEKGTVIISSEVKMDPALQKYQYKLAPDRYHDLLSFSKLYVGEGSTSAIEAAVLGTPALNFERIVVNGKYHTFADFSGVIAEFQDRYDLVHCFCDEELMLKKIDEIKTLGFDKYKMQAKKNQQRLLFDTIDVTNFMVWFIEGYPQSFHQMRENPETQKRFSNQG
jgi:uncharacterized protein